MHENSALIANRLGLCYVCMLVMCKFILPVSSCFTISVYTQMHDIHSKKIHSYIIVRLNLDDIKTSVQSDDSIRQINEIISFAFFSLLNVSFIEYS